MLWLKHPHLPRLPAHCIVSLLSLGSPTLNSSCQQVRQRNVWFSNCYRLLPSCWFNFLRVLLCSAKFVAAESHPWPQLLHRRHHDCGILLPGEGKSGASIVFVPWNRGVQGLSFYLVDRPRKRSSEVFALLPNTYYVALHVEATFHLLISESYENIN